MSRVGVVFRSERRVVPYEEALRGVGVDPVRLNVAARTEWPSNIDGLLLAGGSDIHPSHYGCEPNGLTNNYDKERDFAEIEQLHFASDCSIPILAICRGMQLVNVFRGGTLLQDLGHDSYHLLKTTEADQPGRHRAAHPVMVMPGTRLASILGVSTLDVNSRHHQRIETLGRGLTISACAPDGTIEAIEGIGDEFVIGVQWHPEDRVHASVADRELFRAFANALTNNRRS